MPTLDVSGVIAIQLIEDTTITVADGSGTFAALAGDRYMVAPNQNTMTVSVVGEKYIGMFHTGKRTHDNVAIQAFCPDTMLEAVA